MNIKNLAFALLLTSSFAYAGPHNAKAMQHANPMPNLMQMIVRHADQLDLNESQQESLAAWRAKSHGPMQKMVQSVSKAESDLMQASLRGESKQNLMAMFDAIAATRRDIAEGKTDCRDNMRRILRADQWDTVVSLYADAYPLAMK